MYVACPLKPIFIKFRKLNWILNLTVACEVVISVTQQFSSLKNMSILNRQDSGASVYLCRISVKWYWTEKVIMAKLYFLRPFKVRSVRFSQTARFSKRICFPDLFYRENKQNKFKSLLEFYTAELKSGKGITYLLYRL